MDDSTTVADPERLRGAYRGQGRQMVLVTFLFGALGAVSLVAAALGPGGSDSTLLWVTGVFGVAVALVARYLRRTDPLTHFWKDPGSFRMVRGVLTEAVWVAGGTNTPAGVRALTSFRPLGGNTIVIETRFSVVGWPIAYQKGGELVSVDASGGQPLAALPVEAWVLHKAEAPQVAFLGGLKRG